MCVNEKKQKRPGAMLTLLRVRSARTVNGTAANDETTIISTGIPYEKAYRELYPLKKMSKGCSGVKRPEKSKKTCRTARGGRHYALNVLTEKEDMV